jgi:hypothetical protein
MDRFVEKSARLRKHAGALVPAAFMVDPYPSPARRKKASSPFLKKRTKKLLFS